MKPFIILLVLFSSLTLKSQEAIEYKAHVISSNFTVPILRFNSIDQGVPGAPQDKKGSVAFFNSIGAGIGYYYGDLTEIKEDKKVISTEMDNLFGVQTGFLFSANSSEGSNSNVFAWTISVSILNFQIGYGYEFGTLNSYEKRSFFTLAYGIPISKLLRGGFYKISGKSIGDKKTDLKAGFAF